MNPIVSHVLFENSALILFRLFYVFFTINSLGNCYRPKYLGTKFFSQQSLLIYLHQKSNHQTHLNIFSAPSASVSPDTNINTSLEPEDTNININLEPPNDAEVIDSGVRRQPGSNNPPVFKVIVVVLSAPNDAYLQRLIIDGAVCYIIEYIYIVFT